MNASTLYCDLTDFSKKYELIHGPLSFSVCIFGSVANVLNISVLTTKEMRWPTNLILTGLAIADLLVMLEYIPFTIHRYLNVEGKKYIDNYSYNWASFTIFHALFSQVFHFVSCCLTVILAIWRYMAITSHHSSRIWCDIRRTFLTIVITYLCCPVVCTPLFLSLKIVPYNQTCDHNGRILNKKDLLNHTDIAKKTIYVIDYVSEDYKYMSFWVYGVVIKLVPCILLTHLSRKLIGVLLETKRRRKTLLSSNLAMEDVLEVKPFLQKKLEKYRQADRTSGMLVAILMLFLITEFPQAIMGLLMATKGQQFEKECYRPLGDLMDILALTNSGINFILYCTMSRQFRITFKEIFLVPVLNQFSAGSPYFHMEKPPQEKTQISAV
ncbi:G-protein coupled receptor dmsr-1-like [Anthonomus grandis grandis]|uniref:G-protein coupled receptor dmsr-1-like n=1 Tax=Anthonomus grandis grandis TaxID=2921223 RepID=UPI002165DCB7|nr:G-protein coupled receptor dmsr-1-like [Anthonomus grandis grandis]